MSREQRDRATALFVKAVYYWIVGNPAASALMGKAAKEARR